jgi:hypothetical protein
MLFGLLLLIFVVGLLLVSGVLLMLFKGNGQFERLKSSGEGGGLKGDMERKFETPTKWS